MTTPQAGRYLKIFETGLKGGQALLHTAAFKPVTTSFARSWYSRLIFTADGNCCLRINFVCSDSYSL